jgi:hypothetical protein
MADVCKLTRTPLSLDFDFRGSPGKVTLKLQPSIGGGGIVFRRAVYNGVSLTPMPSGELSFDVVAGLTRLEVIYQFTDPVSGRGTLTEVCAANTQLIDVTATEPAVTYRISA